METFYENDLKDIWDSDLDPVSFTIKKNKTELNKFNNNYHNIREMIYLHGIGIKKFYLKRKSERFLKFFLKNLI